MEIDSGDPPEEPDPVQEALAAAPDAADPGAAYLAILTGFQDLTLSEEGVRAKEECVYRLAERDVRAGRYDAVVDLLAQAAPFFGGVAKAKVAKIVRRLLDIVAGSAETLDLQADLCGRVIEWCLREKRTFLRQRVESRLVAIDFERGLYDAALTRVTKLLRELKQLDDKQMLVETHLLEARARVSGARRGAGEGTSLGRARRHTSGAPRRAPRSACRRASTRRCRTSPRPRRP